MSSNSCACGCRPTTTPSPVHTQVSGTAPSRWPGPTTRLGVFTTWSPTPAMAWGISSLSLRLTSGRCTGWPVTVTNSCPMAWVGASPASPATCTCKPASRPTRWCRTWLRSSGAWPIGRVGPSPSRRTHPKTLSISSLLLTSSMASSPTRARPPRLGTPWPWSAGSIRRIFTGRRWNTLRTL